MEIRECLRLPMDRALVEMFVRRRARLAMDGSEEHG